MLAYLFLISGVLLIYAELIRPGLIFPGVCGVALLSLGLHALWGHHGLILFMAGGALIASETFWDSRWVASFTGILILIGGSLLLAPAWPFLSGALIVGMASAMLARTARRGRRNKAVPPAA